MAMEDPRKRAAEEKKLRIDHSDVYLENDKLAEKLESSLENLSKRRHRQLLSREHEIQQIRRDLNNMKVTKTGALSPATSLRPQTCPATSLHPHSCPAPAPNPDSAPDHAPSSPPSFRRLKPPPVIVRLNVRVPPNSEDDSSDAGENAADGDGDTSDEEQRARERWRRQQQRRWGGRPSVGWGGAERRPSSGARGGGSARERDRPAHEIKRVTKQQLLLHNLDMEAVPASWYTQVHQPSDVIVRHRAASAHPSSRPAHAAANAPPISRKRPASETTKPRLRRTKSALPTASFGSESELFCGGEQQQQQQQEQLKMEALRSRRQLLEVAEGRGQPAAAAAGGGGAWEERGRATRSRINSNRLKFMEAVRLERERLDQRVRLFLRSCDTATKGGVIPGSNNNNNRRTTEYQILQPQTLYS